MKKTKLLALLIVMLMIAMSPMKMWAISGSGTSSKPYQIASASDWTGTTFQNALKNSTSSSKVYAQLTADITLTSVTLRDNDVYIVLDGQGHTISLTGVNTSEENTGLFGKIGGGEVKNLRIGGNLTTSKKYMGNLCGKVTGTLTITNVLCSASLANTTEGDATAGGFIGQINGDVTFNQCGYTYKFYGKGKSNQICGMVGYRSKGTVVFNNCFCKAVWDNVPSGDNYAYMRNDGSSTTYNNCYYVTYGSGGKATDKSSGGPTQIADSKFGTGELAFLLNSQTNGKNRWYQNLSGTKDNYPYPYTTSASTHALVYYGYTHGSTSQTYSNSERWSNQHLYYNTLVSSTWSNTDTPASCKVDMSYKCSTCNATASETLTPSCKTTNATCTIGGNHAYTATSTTYKKDASNYHSATTSYTVSKLKHGCEGYTSSYTWSGTYDAPVCKFTLTCKKCSATVVNAQSITPVQSGKVESTCTTKGSISFKAKGTFTEDANSLSFTDTKYTSHTYGLALLGHDMTTHEAHESTCTEAGNYTYYTCSRSCCANKIYKANTPYTTDEFTDIAATVIAAKGHTWQVNPTWSWADDGSDATCTLTCNNDTNHKMTFDKTTTPAVKITSTESKAATCTEAGEHTYQASVTFNDETYTSPNKVIADIAPSHHTFVDGVCSVCNLDLSKVLCFTAEEDDAKVALVKKGEPNPVSLTYSTDGTNWTDYTIGTTITLAKGQKMYLCAKETNSTFSKTIDDYYKFSLNNKIAASGDVTTLLTPTGSTSVPSCGFLCLFRSCHSLTQAPELPATTLANGCYGNMFEYCTSLTQAPELPATTLAKSCYTFMFYGCTSLTQAPELPATTLAQTCYYNMFTGCESLTRAPELPATTLESSCYELMFRSCKSLTQAPELPATALASGCYYNMFLGCSSLTQAPKLPATALASRCYAFMFQGCTSLTQAPELPATTLATGCYSNMFKGCTSLTKAPELPATTLATGCYSNMFKGCTSLTKAPELPATTLVEKCYYQMFMDCTSLTQTPELPAKTLASNSYYAMFQNCNSLNKVIVNFTGWSDTNTWLENVSSTGTFICPEELNVNDHGANYIPEGWTVKRITPGDVHVDGEKTIADIPALIKILHGDAADTFGTADVDGDGSITLDDVNALRDKILETK